MLNSISWEVESRWQMRGRLNRGSRFRCPRPEIVQWHSECQGLHGGVLQGCSCSRGRKGKNHQQHVSHRGCQQDGWMEDDAYFGCPTIERWEERIEVPCKTAWVARDSLKKLKHTGTVREYVKEFSSRTSYSISFRSPGHRLKQGVKDFSDAADSLVFGKSSESDASKPNKKKGAARKRKMVAKPSWTRKDKLWLFHLQWSSPSGKSKRLSKAREAECLSCRTESDSESPTRVTIVECHPYGVLYIKVLLHGNDVLAMVHTGATWVRIQARCQFGSPGYGLWCAHEHWCLERTIESNRMVVPLDSFYVILVNDFFVAAKWRWVGW